jgi:6-phosphogluconolactonase (cycloisomerase 2 family)
MIDQPPRDYASGAAVARTEGTCISSPVLPRTCPYDLRPSAIGNTSAFAVNRTDGTLEVLDTVPSGGAGPTFVSVHPSGRFVLHVDLGLDKIFVWRFDQQKGSSTSLAWSGGSGRPTAARASLD